MSMRWGKLYEGTPAELALEDAIAALGVPYRTQFPGWKYGFRYFPDFFLPTLRLIVEVDDRSHDQKAEADAERTEVLNSFGWQVVRCTNDEALDDPHGTIQRLLSSVGLWPIPAKLPRVADSLPPVRRASQRARRKSQAEIRQARREALQRARSSPPKRPKPRSKLPSTSSL